MNHAISTNLDALAPEKLPPAARSSQVRMLFISTVGLGFRRYFEQMVHYAGLDPDIAAVHVEVRQPQAVKVFCASIPLLSRRGWDQKSLRYHIAWRPILRRWFSGPLPLSRFDVVHITHGIAWGLVPFASRSQTRFAVNVDVTAVQDHRELGYAELGRLPMVAVERRIYDSANLVVCRNRWCCRSVVEDFHVPADRTHVALSSLPLPERWRGQSGARQGLVRLVFIGHQFERKGGPELLRLHQQRLTDRAELHICSGGAVPDRSARNVIWHGNVPNEKLRNDLLPEMDLFVFPTRHDMSPWAVIEAAGAGLPVIATRVGAIPDMVLDGKGGILVEPGRMDDFAAAVERLVNDAGVRQSMGAAAREHMRLNYNPDQEFPGLLNRLKRLADSPRPPSAIQQT